VEAAMPERTLTQCQREVDEWIRTVGVRYFSELTNTAVLMEEVGESADLGMEMADVLFVLVCLANQTGVDLEEAFSRAMEKRTRRDRERHANNPKLRG
jgi:NTP pyrophosphatase (non-canonical NTP hydrolase)